MKLRAAFQMEKWMLLSGIILSLGVNGFAQNPSGSTHSSLSKRMGVDDESAEAQVCTSSREYITTLEYLRAQKQFALSESEARKRALSVSLGCKDAAGRFIQVVSVLSVAGLSTLDAIDIGVKFAAKTSADVDAFLTLFKSSFLSEGLDLDLRNALNLAKSLTLEYSGDATLAKQDFERLVEFCHGKESQGLELSLPQCGEFAARVARLGDKQDTGISEPFLKLFYFLITRSEGSSSGGPGLSKSEALKLSEKMVQISPYAAENFMQAYRYAIAPVGLSLDVQSSIDFAIQLASTTSAKN